MSVGGSNGPRLVDADEFCFELLIICLSDSGIHFVGDAGHIDRGSPFAAFAQRSRNAHAPLLVLTASTCHLPCATCGPLILKGLRLVAHRPCHVWPRSFPFTISHTLNAPHCHSVRATDARIGQ